MHFLFDFRQKYDRICLEDEIMELFKVDMLPINYTIDKELLSLIAEANQKYGEYKTNLKNSKFDSRFFTVGSNEYPNTIWWGKIELIGINGLKQYYSVFGEVILIFEAPICMILLIYQIIYLKIIRKRFK